MRRRLSASALLVGILLVAGLAPSALAQSPVVSVPLNLPAPTAPEKSSSAFLGECAAKLVESSNFNSYHQPQVVGSIPEIQQRYRQTAAGNNLVITYAEPVKFKTEGDRK